MRELSVSVSTLFRELPFLDRFAAAAEHGFSAVEFWWPPLEVLDSLVDAVERAGVRVSMFTLSGALADPDHSTRLAIGLELAARLACTRVYTLIGHRRPDRSAAAELATVRERLAWVADAARAHGITVLVEPVNAGDNGPQVIERTSEVTALLDELARDNTALLFDIYHVRRAEGDVAGAFERVHHHVGHVHLSDFPGRVEPGAGELDFAAVDAALARHGYTGTLGLEYTPSTPTTPESFAALARAGLRTIGP